MSTFDYGAPVTLGITLRDSTGALANATSVTCTVTQPDGTTVSATVTNPSTGTYVATLTPTQLGDHVAYWVGSGTNADTKYQTFSVTPANMFELEELGYLLRVTVDEAAADVARHTAQGLIRSYCRQNITRAAYTAASLPIHTGSDGHYAVRLPQRPVSAVSSVSVNGTAYTADVDYTWDGVNALLRLRYLKESTATFVDEPRAVVTYTAGYLVCPAAVKGVALSVAARAYDNPRGFRTEAIDDYSYTRAGSDDDLAGLTLTAAEKHALAAYRVTAGSVVLR